MGGYAEGLVCAEPGAFLPDTLIFGLYTLTFCNVEAEVGSFDFPFISFYPVLPVMNLSAVEILLGRGIHGGYWISDGLNVLINCLPVRLKVKFIPTFIYQI
jgi:hypothetical protein